MLSFVSEKCYVFLVFSSLLLCLSETFSSFYLSFTSLNRFILGILFLLVLWIVFSSTTSPNWLLFAHTKKHWFLYIACVHAKLFQLDLTLWDPMDHRPPGFSVHGILQARILDWVAISSLRGSSWPRDWTLISGFSCIGRQILYH